MSDTAIAPGMTIEQALRAATAALRTAGFEGPRREAGLLARIALGLDRTALLVSGDRRLDPGEAARLERSLARRLAHEPPSRIAGEREFWSLAFELSPATLDPRPDTETLVEAVLERVPDRSARLSVLDLGTGTGCILAALLTELPESTGVGIDRSVEAVGTARRNAARLGLVDRAGFVAADWASAIEGRFDIIVSNPPYVPTADIASLDPGVSRWDPPAALDGGADGLAAYRTLAPELCRLLAAGGIAALEVGIGQADAVAALLARAGLRHVDTRGDLNGVARVVVAESREIRTKIAFQTRFEGLRYEPDGPAGAARGRAS